MSVDRVAVDCDGRGAQLPVAAPGSRAYRLGDLWHRVKKFIGRGEAVAALAAGEAIERRMR